VELDVGVTPADADVADPDVTLTPTPDLDHVPFLVELNDVECSCQVVFFVEGL